MIYTVIGVYEDSAQVFADHVEADGPFQAMRVVAKNTAEPDNLQILGAILGEHQVIAACEEAGSSAYAVDLR